LEGNHAQEQPQLSSCAHSDQSHSGIEDKMHQSDQTTAQETPRAEQDENDKLLELNRIRDQDELLKQSAACEPGNSKKE